MIPRLPMIPKCMEEIRKRNQGKKVEDKRSNGGARVKGFSYTGIVGSAMPKYPKQRLKNTEN